MENFVSTFFGVDFGQLFFLLFPKNWHIGEDEGGEGYDWKP
jgi:hypothetical protein